MTDEKREVRAIVRTYKDNDGNDKNVYATVGTAWVSEHGSKISLQLETIPITPDWNGKLYINKPYTPKEAPKDDNQLTHEFNQRVTQDNLPTDDDMNESISDGIARIPF